MYDICIDGTKSMVANTRGCIAHVKAIASPESTSNHWINHLEAFAVKNNPNSLNGVRLVCEKYFFNRNNWIHVFAVRFMTK